MTRSVALRLWLPFDVLSFASKATCLAFPLSLHPRGAVHISLFERPSSPLLPSPGPREAHSQQYTLNSKISNLTKKAVALERLREQGAIPPRLHLVH